MFFNIFSFELRYWLRQPMMYVFFLINFLLVFFAAASNDISIGGSFGNVYKNAPYVIQSTFGAMSIIGLLMTTAFVQNATLRDFNYKTYQIVFSSPISKMSYLGGRFTGAVLVSLFPFLGVSLGFLLGPSAGVAFGWIEPFRVGEVNLMAHLNGFLTFAIPNTIFTAAVVFSIAALTRSTLTSFLGAVVLLVGYSITGSFLSDLDSEYLAVIFDAFGERPLSLFTKYWTVEEKNTLSVPVTAGFMMLNRSIWLSVSIIVLGFVYSRFSFAEKNSRKKNKTLLPEQAENTKSWIESKPLPAVSQSFGASALSVQLMSQAKSDFMSVIKGTAFIVIVFLGLLNMGFALQYAGKFYGLSSYPVSYQTIDLIRGTMYLFIIAILMFYSGSLIWKERDANVEQVYDATPHPSWVSFVSKLLAMTGVIAILMLLCVFAGVSAQALMGYTNFEFGLYFTEFFLIDLSGMICIIVLSMLVHTLINNKYIAFFVFLVIMILNAFIWRPLDIESNMIQFSATPDYTYSDMNGYGPFVSGKFWFRIYWLLFCGILSMVSIIFWVRGKDEDWKSRWKKAKLSFSGGTKWITVGFVALFLACGGWVYYNTQVLNHYTTAKARLVQQAEYEKKYKKYEAIPQPRVTAAKYDIQLFPEQRNLKVKASLTLKNKSDTPIDSLHLTLLPEYMRLTVNLEGAKKVLNDTQNGYCIYQLGSPLAPGDSIMMNFTTEYDSKGFENEVSVTEIVQNGTFFNNSDITPQIGYQDDYEISDKSERIKKGLKEKSRLPALEKNCTKHCMNTYTSNNSDWVNVETIFSTSENQIAIAPGSLVKEWKEGNRRFFHYKLDHPSLNFYSFTSAEFEVAREKWNGIDVEVYYDKKHPYNVKSMLNSVKKSLAYYTENFGPYYHKQARIIEFPRYSSFAQAFPGTMPYSESIGFIARIDKEEDIDMVFYVVAHEMGHQWWAHQVIGAKMQGATLLSETFAQYSALMVMEKEFGKNQMRKFLKYEGDKYLDRRGSESVKEVSSMKVENQGYIHYNKGSMVMYNLKEMIGEDKVNTALRELIAKYGYKEPPYPVSYDVVDLFKQQTPDSLQYMITDLFEEITVFANKVVEAKSKKLPDGKYEVTMKVECGKFRSDSLGKETAININDWVDIGVFAMPEKGKEDGEVIAMRRERMAKKEETFTIITDKVPYEAVIDPLNYLVDRIPKDNKKKTENAE
ncbi:MAG: hypothetical protein K1X92_09070 [Bacteroidia bacterium]|nr:hypothetical protein [Bacteroidia bacterium]